MPKNQTKSVKARSLKIDVYDVKGNVVESYDLPKEIFGVSINQPLMAQAVRVYLTNQRQGNAQAKTRGQVSGSTKKMGRQKGSGRARHGSITAPVYVGGGKAHGPQPRNIHLDLPKKMRRMALLSALASKASTGNVVVVTGFESIEPRTKVFAKAVQNHSQQDGRTQRILFVMPQKFDNVVRASRNLPNVTLDSAATLNTYEVLNAKKVILMKDAIKKLEETFLRKG